MTRMGPWIAVLEIAAACAVFVDARRRGLTFGGPTGRDGSLGAPGWALLTLVVAPLAVPAYLFRRSRRGSA
jgi:hypothetical protein